jgi:hypothetical protein
MSQAKVDGCGLGERGIRAMWTSTLTFFAAQVNAVLVLTFKLLTRKYI